MKIFVVATLLFSSAVLTAAQRGQVIGFDLVKATSGAFVSSLTNETIIAIAPGETPKFNVVAKTSSGQIDSVQFDLDGVVNYRTEYESIYALCGNNGNYYNVCSKLVAGSHTVTAKAKNGKPFTVTFKIGGPYEALQLDKRAVVQLGPRPYFLVKAMKPSPLKTTLGMYKQSIVPVCSTIALFLPRVNRFCREMRGREEAIPSFRLLDRTPWCKSSAPRTHRVIVRRCLHHGSGYRGVRHHFHQRSRTRVPSRPV